MHLTLSLALAFSALVSAYDPLITGNLYTDADCADTKPLVVHDNEANCFHLQDEYLSIKGHVEGKQNEPHCHIFLFSDNNCKNEFDSGSMPKLDRTCHQLEKKPGSAMAVCA